MLWVVLIYRLADCRLQQELAIVRYQGASEDDPAADESVDRNGFELNPYNEMKSESNMYISDVESLGKKLKETC